MKKGVLIFLCLVVAGIIFVPFPKKQPCLSPRPSSSGFLPCEPEIFIAYSYFDYVMLQVGLPGKLTPQRVAPPAQ